MDKILQDIIIKKYPVLCKRTKLSSYKSCMGRGFVVGNGWFKLVCELCLKLSKIDGVELEQVKEKLGFLTVYIDGGNSETRTIINEMSGRSAGICEKCGEKGERRGGSWIRVLCDKCNR